MKLKYLIACLVPVLLTGCATLNFLLGDGDSPGVLTQAGGVLKDSGNPTYIAAGFAVTTLVAIGKALRSGSNLRETVSSVNDGLKELDEDQLAAVKKTISASMPASVKKVVASIRKTL